MTGSKQNIHVSMDEKLKFNGNKGFPLRGKLSAKPTDEGHKGRVLL